MKLKEFETIGELVKFLQTLPQDTKIVSRGLSGYKLGKLINFSTRNFCIKQCTTVDCFDNEETDRVVPLLSEQKEENAIKAIVL